MPAEPNDIESRQAMSEMLKALTPEDVRASRKRRDLTSNLAYLAMLNEISVEARAKGNDARNRIHKLFDKFGEGYESGDRTKNVINSPEGSVFMVTTENDDGLEIHKHLGRGAHELDYRSGEKVFFAAAIYRDNWNSDTLFAIRPGRKVPLKSSYEITLVDLPEVNEESSE